MNRYERLLRYLYNEGSIEGFCHLEKDCWEYACDLANGEEPTEEQNFEGWLLMIEDAIKEDERLDNESK